MWGKVSCLRTQHNDRDCMFPEYFSHVNYFGVGKEYCWSNGAISFLVSQNVSCVPRTFVQNPTYID